MNSIKPLYTYLDELDFESKTAQHAKYFGLDIMVYRQFVFGFLQKLYERIADESAQPETKPLTLDELGQMDGEPVYYAWDDIGWSKVVVIDGHPRIAATINHGRGYECALYTPTDIEGNSYAYRSKPGEKV